MAGPAAAPAELTAGEDYGPAATPSPTAVDESDQGADAGQAGALDDGDPLASADESHPPRRGATVVTAPHRLAGIVGLIVVLVLGGLVGWLGLQASRAHHAEQLRARYLSAGQRGALNLTTIDWRSADADVQRVLDVSTSPFHDDFGGRAQPFVDAVKQAQSTSVGTITSAGIESEDADGAQVLVAVSVKVSAAGAEQNPRAWRMRFTMKKVGDDAKVSNVQFVP